MRLYHFTTWFHLPSILETGITKGQVPVHPDPRRFESAPNLTSSPEAHSQLGWANPPGISPFDKTKIRITVEIPDADPRLERWEAITRRYPEHRRWFRLVTRSAQGQAKFWFIFRGVIPPEWFVSVELKDEGGGYTPLDEKERGELVSRIIEEKTRFTFIQLEHGYSRFELNDGETSWLLDL